MKHDGLTETLKQLGFTQYEAQCYIGLALCVCLSRWASWRSSDTRRFRDYAQDSSRVLGMSYSSSLALR